MGDESLAYLILILLIIVVILFMRLLERAKKRHYNNFVCGPYYANFLNQLGVKEILNHEKIRKSGYRGNYFKYRGFDFMLTVRHAGSRGDSFFMYLSFSLKFKKIKKAEAREIKNFSFQPKFGWASYTFLIFEYPPSVEEVYEVIDDFFEEFNRIYGHYPEKQEKKARHN